MRNTAFKFSQLQFAKFVKFGGKEQGHTVPLVARNRAIEGYDNF